MDFIYCFNKETKEKLLMSGYTFISETNHLGNKAYLFWNNGNKLTFSNGEVEITNKMYF